MAEFVYYSELSFTVMMAASAIAVLLFIVGMIWNMKKWGGGSATRFLKVFFASTFDKHAPSVIVTLVLDILLQRRTLRMKPTRWLWHMAIFWGWIMLFIFSLVLAAYEVAEKAGSPIGNPAAIREALAFPNEVFGYLLFAGLIVALARRVIFKDVSQRSFQYDWVLLLGLLLITITGFISEGIRVGSAWGLGISSASAPPAALFHVVISLLFCIAYIPFSKYVHMLATPISILANHGGE